MQRPGGEPGRRARPELRLGSAILDEGQVAIAALATGYKLGCVDECVRYRPPARGVQPPSPASYKAVQFCSADMEARAHCARLAWYDAAARRWW